MVAKEIVFQNGPGAEWIEVRRNKCEIYTKGIFRIGYVKESGGASVDVEEIVIRAKGEKLLAKVAGIFPTPDNVVAVEVAG